MNRIQGCKGVLTDTNLHSLDFFIPSAYKNSKGEERSHYLLTREGCEGDY